MEYILNPIVLYGFLQFVLVITISVRVIMNRPSVGVALAWLLIVALIPVAGILLYFTIGERRISPRRMQRRASLLSDFKSIANTVFSKNLVDIDWSAMTDGAQSMNSLGTNLLGSKTVTGNRYQFCSDAQEILEAIKKDIDSAKTSVLVEFYIWNKGGAADAVLDAIIAAAGRGVSCRVLVDDIGGAPWWVRKALPAGIFRTIVGRTDLRLHRKIVVIDGKFGWTGSMNMVDPRYFKQDAGVGEWVDAMVRVEGAVVNLLSLVMLADWVLESGESVLDLMAELDLNKTSQVGNAPTQVIPSGPGSAITILQMLLTLVNSARKTLVLTTPYYVPDDSLRLAIKGAVGRGVDVAIVLPGKVDSFLTRYASQSYYDGLLESGVKIYLYHGGLLHTKSITVDGEISMFGTVNLDMRSLYLNYEISLFVYDHEFTATLYELQREYMENSELLDRDAWAKRPRGKQLLENTLRLMSPLL
jgi:cardiolipin synthase